MDPDDIATSKFSQMSVLAVIVSILLHAGVALALWPAPTIEEHRVTERLVEVSLVLPSPPPASREPDLALLLPAPEPPPPISANDFASMPAPPATSPIATPPITASLPAVETPAVVTQRELAMTAPASLAPRQPVQHRRPAGRALEGGGAGDQNAQRDYVWQVVQRLSRNRFAASVADGGAGGMVVARLTVARDGRLLDVTLAMSSGAPRLDRVVTDTIHRAAPFPPLPAGFAGDHYSFVVPIRYAPES